LAQKTARPTGADAFLEGFFKLKEAGTNVRTEVLAGLTTFVVMSYIIFVNPIILSTPDANGQGLAISATTTATCLVAGIMTIIMALVTNKAYAIAPGMGLNAIVAFTLVGQEGLTYPEAMGVIVAQGILITLLVIFGVRKYVMDAVPLELKQGISVGIGLFILFIGLVNGGIVVADPGTMIALGDLRGAPDGCWSGRNAGVAFTKHQGGHSDRYSGFNGVRHHRRGDRRYGTVCSRPGKDAGFDRCDPGLQHNRRFFVQLLC
jgi:AGZA family xanthine/uracil permease-like MFS transporter